MLCTSSFVDDIMVIMNFQRMLFTIIVPAVTAKLPLVGGSVFVHYSSDHDVGHCRWLVACSVQYKS